jgi:hypothetical protein
MRNKHGHCWGKHLADPSLTNQHERLLATMNNITKHHCNFFTVFPSAKNRKDISKLIENFLYIIEQNAVEYIMDIVYAADEDEGEYIPNLTVYYTKESIRHKKWLEKTKDWFDKDGLWSKDPYKSTILEEIIGDICIADIRLEKGRHQGDTILLLKKLAVYFDNLQSINSDNIISMNFDDDVDDDLERAHFKVIYRKPVPKRRPTV